MPPAPTVSQLSPAPSERIPIIEPALPKAEAPAIPEPFSPASDRPSEPLLPSLAAAPEPVSARIIPFVPRGGYQRDVKPLTTAPPAPFARPAPYFVSPADGAPMSPPQPAVPPPPTGFRRPAEWVRSVPAQARPEAGALAMPQPGAAAGRAADWLAQFNVRSWVKRIFQVLGVLLVAYVTLVLTLVVAYRWIDPPMSALMLGQRLSGTEIKQQWVSLDRISPSLMQAVVLSEDGRFCSHRGVDWAELKDAIEQSLEGWGARGGSTISMQTAKNLFLWPSKSYVRKAVEIPLAMGTEMVWPKARMLEIYLNIAEWGPGIFGAEAAARYHFGKSASALTPREAALLAVSLPNPFDRQAGHPGPGTQRLADNIQNRMRRVPNAVSCVRPSRPTRPGIADSRWP